MIAESSIKRAMAVVLVSLFLVLVYTSSTSYYAVPLPREVNSSIQPVMGTDRSENRD